MSFDFDIESVLVEPTIQRPESADRPTDTDYSKFDDLEFSSPPPPSEATGPSNPELPEEVKEVEVELFPYDPKENADVLVDMLDEINKLTMTPLARWKCAKNQGGRAEVRKMQVIAAKKFNDEKLTKQEAKQLNQYQAYLKDKEELEQAIPYSEAELKKLKRSAEAYLKRVKWKVGDGGAAFWTEFGIIQGSRMIDIMTT